MTQNIISIEDVAHSLNIQLDSGQTRTSKALDQLSEEIMQNSSNSLLKFFSKGKKMYFTCKKHNLKGMFKKPRYPLVHRVIQERKKFSPLRRQYFCLKKY